MRRHWIKRILFICLLIGLMAAPAVPGFAEEVSDMQSGILSLEKPTAAEIYQKWLTVTYPEGIYAEKPVVSSPYSAGSLDPSFINNGVSYLNYVRYVAGLDSVPLNDSFNAAAQVGAVLLAARNELTHYPAKPADMDENFYNIGYAAAANSNVSKGHYTLQAALQGGIDDNLENNLTSLGHRRWLLNPALRNAGFGFAVSADGSPYVLARVFDLSTAAGDYNFISWPASGNMPTELIKTNVPWSVTFNPQKYNVNSLQDAKVTVVRESDNMMWSFDRSLENAPSREDSYFAVSTSNMGVGNALIFNIGSQNLDTDTLLGNYTVTITGIKDIYGNDTAIRYTVNFFDMLVGIDSVTIGSPSPYLAVGGTAQLSAAVLPEDASLKKIVWSISDPSIAMIDQNGFVTCVTNEPEQQVIVWADTMDGSGKYHGIYLNTIIPVESVSLNTTSMVMTKISKTEQLTATVFPENATIKDVRWTNSNPEIAEMDANGQVYAHENGTTVITATTREGGKTVSCTVTVEFAVTGVYLNYRSVYFTRKDETFRLNARVLPTKAYNKKVTWSSSNPDVATVNSQGVITTKGDGKTVITVTTDDGKFTAFCNVEVKIPHPPQTAGEQGIKKGEDK